MNTRKIFIGHRRHAMWRWMGGFTAAAMFGWAGNAIAGAGERAIPYVYPYNTMTAAEVVQKLMTPPVSDADFRERDRAYHYVAGLKDGTQGTVWCFRNPVKPDESTYEVVGAIKESYPPEALKGNAAPLVLKELQRRYPCGRVPGARP